MSRVTPSSHWTVLLPGFIVGGIGIGLVNAPLASTAVSTVRVERAGMASGINNTFRQLGIATGIAAPGLPARSTRAAGHATAAVIVATTSCSSGRLRSASSMRPQDFVAVRPKAS